MKTSIDRQLEFFRLLIKESYHKGELFLSGNTFVINLAEWLYQKGVLQIVSDLPDDHNIGNPVSLQGYRSPRPIHQLDFQEIFRFLKAEGLIDIQSKKKYRKYLASCSTPPLHSNMHGIDHFVDSVNMLLDKEITIMQSFLNLELPAFDIDHATNTGFSEMTLKGLIEANEVLNKKYDFRLALHGLYRFLIVRMLVDMGTITGHPIHQSTGGKFPSSTSPLYDNLAKNKVKMGFKKEYIQDTFTYLSNVIHGNRSDIDENMLNQANEIIRVFANEWQK